MEKALLDVEGMVITEMLTLAEIAERSRKQIRFTEDELVEMGHGIARELMEGNKGLEPEILVEYMVHAVCVEAVRKVIKAVDQTLKQYEIEDG